MGNEIDIQSQEAQRTPIKINKNRPTPRHISIEFAKYSAKKIIFKAVRQKMSLTYKGKPIRLAGDFSTESDMKTEECAQMYSKC